MTPVRRFRFLAIALAVCVAGATAPRTLQAEVMPHLAMLPMFAHSHKKKSTTPAQTTAAKTTTAKKTSSHWKSSKEKTANTAAKSGSSMRTEEHGKTEAKTENRSANHSEMSGQRPPAAGMVWVNTSSKVYHKNGSKFYGKTKHGKWMTESEASKAGYKPARN